MKDLNALTAFKGSPEINNRFLELFPVLFQLKRMNTTNGGMDLQGITIFRPPALNRNTE